MKKSKNNKKETKKQKTKGEQPASEKVMRMLDIYTMLISGETIKRDELTKKYEKGVRTIQRDMSDMQYYAKNSPMMVGNNKIICGNTKTEYRLEKANTTLSSSEILAVCKILLDSRAFKKEQLSKILHCLIDYCIEDKKLIYDLIQNEEFHYIETYHEYEFMDKLWKIGKAIQEKRYIEVNYKRVTNNKQKKIVKRKLKPIAILFWEYYFYLVAFIDDKDNQQNFNGLDELCPIVYRIDRMEKLTVLEEKFYIPYKILANDIHVNEGEFRKRVQFMRGGRLRKVKFLYSGDDINGVCDRLPTAKIVSEKDGVYTVEAEVFGDGIDMWLRMHEHDVEEIK